MTSQMIAHELGHLWGAEHDGVQSHENGVYKGNIQIIHPIKGYTLCGFLPI